MEEIPLSAFISRPRLESTSSSRRLNDLPESLICAVLTQVSEIGGGFSHALVCRQWAQTSMEAQRRVVVRVGASIADSDLLNELRGFPNLRELQMKKYSALRLTDRFFLGIRRTCPRLESIIIPGASSALRTEFSTYGLRRMISSLPGLKTIVLRAEKGHHWDVPDSLSKLCRLKVLAVGPCNPQAALVGMRVSVSSQSSVLRIPPSTRELSFCNRTSWGVAGEEGGLQGVRSLIAEVTLSEVIPEALWDTCSLRSLTIKAQSCRHLTAGVSRLTGLRQLQLDLDRVMDLPDCFSTLQPLTQLKLGSKRVPALPGSLWSLTSLRHLSLHCSRLRSIDSRVGQLQRLTSLEVFSWQEFNLPSSLCGHSALCELHLDLPKVQPSFELRARALTKANFRLSAETNFSRFLRGCESLSSLHMGGARGASSLPGNTGLPPSLQNLKIYGMHDLGPALPNSLGCYINLETLKIVGCDGINELPWSIVECGRLTKLTVQECGHLRKLPPRFCSLGNLRTLRIRKCPELQSLPRSVGQLSTLEKLYLDNSNVRSIPNSLGAAHRLCSLNLWCCERLTRLPDSVGQLALLTNLSVMSCPLVKVLPASMSQLFSLNVLELVRLPALHFLPEGVEKITTLHSLLVMQCTSLQGLPSELGRLENVHRVVINDCHTLRHLPPSIGDLLHLKRLHLISLPSLSGIPQQIGQLSGLRDLFISNLPSLTSLPGSMTRLTGLAELRIQDCHSLAWVPHLLESLSRISKGSKLGLRRLMETGALRGIQQRRSRHTRRSRKREA